MAEQFAALAPEHRSFIAAQHLFFVGTAARDGRVNVSPKGMDTLRIVAADRVQWLNLTGSGNESAAHLLDHPRMTLMFCSFDRLPLILRIYGTARAIHPRDPEWAGMVAQFPPNPGARQCFDLAIDLVVTSCGYAVPEMTFKAERPTLTMWSEKRGPDGIRAYWAEKNVSSLDGYPTGILEPPVPGK